MLLEEDDLRPPAGPASPDEGCSDRAEPVPVAEEVELAARRIAAIRVPVPTAAAVILTFVPAVVAEIPVTRESAAASSAAA